MRLIIITLLMATLFFIPSCVEDNFEEFIPDTTEEPDSLTVRTEEIKALDSLMNFLTEGVENETTTSFRFLVSSDTLLSCACGGGYFFLANCFGTKDELGADTIDVKITELFTKEHFMRYQKPTISNNKPLISEGVIRVEAWLNGQRLTLEIPDGIQAQFPITNAEYANQMQLFTGVTETSEYNPDERIFVWNQDNPDLGEVINNDTSSNVSILDNGYAFDLSLFNWINCDAFYGLPAEQLAQVNLTLPENYSFENTRAYLYFKSENTLLQMFSLGEQPNNFVSENIPKDREVRIITISTIAQDDKGEDISILLGDTGFFTVGTDNNKTLVPEQATKESIDNFLKNL